jgi:hypothetical protein
MPNFLAYASPNVGMNTITTPVVSPPQLPIFVSDQFNRTGSVNSSSLSQAEAIQNLTNSGIFRGQNDLFFNPFPPISSTSSSVVINFDDLAVGTRVLRSYAERFGITFADSNTVVDYPNNPEFTHSQAKFVQPCSLQSKEFCTNPIVMTFYQDKKQVKFWVGYSGKPAREFIVLSTAFDKDGKPVSVDKFAIPLTESNEIPIRRQVLLQSDGNATTATIHSIILIYVRS